MESIRIWARGLFLLAVFSSTAMLLVPKSMVKQVKFVSELLLLLCVIAPIAALIRSEGGIGLPSAQVPTVPDEFSLSRFYSKETARRVAELGETTGVRVQSVNVVMKDGGLALGEVAVVVGPGATGEQLAAFKEAVRIYAGIPKDNVRLVVESP